MLIWNAFLCSKFLVTLEIRLVSYIIKPPPMRFQYCRTAKRPSACRNPACAHCRDDIHEGQDVLVHTNCNNGWHQQCLQEWADFRSYDKETCPICTETLSKSASTIQRAGDPGHTWRPAALSLLIVRSYTLCCVWGLLHLFDYYLLGCKLGVTPRIMLLYWATVATTLLAHRLVIHPRWRLDRIVVYLSVLFVSAVALGYSVKHAHVMSVRPCFFTCIVGYLLSHWILLDSDVIHAKDGMVLIFH